MQAIALSFDDNMVALIKLLTCVILKTALRRQHQRGASDMGDQDPPLPLVAGPSQHCGQCCWWRGVGSCVKINMLTRIVTTDLGSVWSCHLIPIKSQLPSKHELKLYMLPVILESSQWCRLQRRRALPALHQQSRVWFCRHRSWTCWRCRCRSGPRWSWRGSWGWRCRWGWTGSCRWCSHQHR